MEKWEVSKYLDLVHLSLWGPALGKGDKIERMSSEYCNEMRASSVQLLLGKLKFM
jgi:hypothetical protein